MSDEMLVSYDIFGNKIVVNRNEEGEVEKVVKKEWLSPYDFIKCITGKTEVSEKMNDQINCSKYPRYVIDTWLGSSPKLIHLICRLQEVPEMTNFQHFTALYRTIPTGMYVPYLFKKAGKVSEEIEAIKFYFKCKDSLAYKYKRVINSSQMNELITYMKYEKKQNLSKLKKNKKKLIF